MTHKIMVVDDNTATRRMVRNALQRNGHSVIEAPDGKTARELMVREHPRVVLQDLMLPDADGFELVGELRNLAGQDVSILAFSGFVSKLDEARVSSVGFDDIITKPIAPSRLVPLIEAHLPALAPSTERFGAGRRIVFADDDPMQLKLASFRLGRLGFAVEAVPDGRAAIEAIKRKRPDAVVSDVMMPELDGFGLAIALRQDPELHELPLLLVTSSYIESTDRELARRAGATDLVLRTPELTELIDLLRVTLDGNYAPPLIAPEAVPELERERNRRVFRQLERQVLLNTGLAKRCSALASELTVLTGISEAVLKHRDVDTALDEALAACFDAGGISVGALYLYEAGSDALRVRPLGGDPQWSSDKLPTFFGHEKVLRDVIASGKPLYLPSTQIDVSVADDLLSKCRATAILVVPLVHLGAPLGGLLMAARGRELDQEDWSAFALGVATQITHVLALARVYAEREEAERRATEHAALLDALVASAPDYVFNVDLEGTIRFINRVIGDRTIEQVIGTSWFDYYPPDQQTTARAAMARMIATGDPTEFEVQGTRADGTAGWYSARIGPVKDAGKIVGAVVIARDVSDKKQTEMQLMLADRMASVGTLAAGVAHEINNPLASVIANLDMAVADVRNVTTELPGDLVEELRDARAAADRVREIVRDLKIFSRAEDDRRGPVDVEQVLESTLRMAWNEIRHRARLVKNYHEVPFVDANESRLGQVFLNLLVNAVQAIPEGRYAENQITVSTATDIAGRVIVTIADTGTGIPPHVRSRLFTPFFTTKPVGVGTGLGLAISHRIITSFGGTITFETETGKGTEFRVALPGIGNVEMPVVGRTITRGMPPRRGRVLVVDDEDMLTQAICRYLAANHDVAGVSNGRAALDLLAAGERYDIILCDLMMPQVTGMELYAEVKKLDPEQASRIVFLTGGAFTANAREFLDSTTNRRLEKPFDLKTLRRLVNDLLG